MFASLSVLSGIHNVVLLKKPPKMNEFFYFELDQEEPTISNIIISTLSMSVTVKPQIKKIKLIDCIVSDDLLEIYNRKYNNIEVEMIRCQIYQNIK